MAEETQVVMWVDAAGHARLTVVECADETTDAIVDQIKACSNADIVWRVKGEPIRPGASPVNAQWPRVVDEVRWHAIVSHLATTTGASIVIPAPQARVFLEDGQTLDRSVDDVSDLEDACIGHLRTTDGGFVVGEMGDAVRSQQPDYGSILP